MAVKLINTHRAALDRLAGALLEKETLERTELDAVLGVAPDKSNLPGPVQGLGGQTVV
jgi:ATP-dependent Zn protease